MKEGTSGGEKPYTQNEARLSVCVLASGSKGNAIYVSDGETAILIDAGLSGIEIERRLREKGLEADDIHAILVSHEHSDHIRGVGVLSRRYDIPVYINKGTESEAVAAMGTIKRTEPFSCGRSFQINHLTIHPFSTSHDACDPSGFTISRNSIKISLATDLGIATHMVKEHLKGSALVLLEANHDINMLENGPYPWPVKQRIRSRLGHLSNTESRDLLMEIRHEGLGRVILGHLSETNNTPEKALREIGPALAGSKTKLTVATQERCGEIYYVEGSKGDSTCF
ncbi:MAG: MBL fold metallo-hydrolase [Desulfobacteraceae bacterium]|nr:MBL fold metallo-hydrolase [Desulfobacteraceae bacterium]